MCVCGFSRSFVHSVKCVSVGVRVCMSVKCVSVCVRVYMSVSVCLCAHVCRVSLRALCCACALCLCVCVRCVWLCAFRVVHVCKVCVCVCSCVYVCQCVSVRACLSSNQCVHVCQVSVCVSLFRGKPALSRKLVRFGSTVRAIPTTDLSVLLLERIVCHGSP